MGSSTGASTGTSTSSSSRRPRPSATATSCRAGACASGPAALGRAGAVVLTRTERVRAEAAEDALLGIAAHYSGPMARCRFEPGPPEVGDELRGARVFALCGIGNPDAFLGTLSDLGAEIVGRRLLRDHEVLPEGGIPNLLVEARAAGAECVVTTRKDAVKYDNLTSEYVVVDVEAVVTHGEAELWAAVERVLPTAASSSSGS